MRALLCSAFLAIFVDVSYGFFGGLPALQFIGRRPLPSKCGSAPWKRPVDSSGLHMMTTSMQSPLSRKTFVSSAVLSFVSLQHVYAESQGVRSIFRLCCFYPITQVSYPMTPIRIPGIRCRGTRSRGTCRIGSTS